MAAAVRISRSGTERKPQKYSLAWTCEKSFGRPPIFFGVQQEAGLCVRPQFLHVPVVVTPNRTGKKSLRRFACKNRASSAKWETFSTMLDSSTPSERLFCQGDNVPLETTDFVFPRLLRIDLVKIGADAEKCPAWGDRRKIRFFKAVASVQKIFHAIALRQNFPVIERVDEKFLGGRLETAKEMSRHADPGHRQVQAPGEQQVNQTKADRVAFAAIDHFVEVAVFRLVIFFFVAVIALEFEKIFVDGGDHLPRRRAVIEAFA